MFYYFFVPVYSPKGWQPIIHLYFLILGLFSWYCFLSSPLFYFLRLLILLQPLLNVYSLLNRRTLKPFLISKASLPTFPFMASRRLEDFDKYEALALAEQPATSSSLKADDKVSGKMPSLPLCEKSYLLVPSSLRHTLYYVALLADKEYSKIRDTVAKVDKTFKKQDPQAAPRQGSTPGPSRPRALICCACGVPGHIASRCYWRSTHPYSIPKPLMAPPSYKKWSRNHIWTIIIWVSRFLIITLLMQTCLCCLINSVFVFSFESSVVTSILVTIILFFFLLSHSPLFHTRK